MEESRMPVTWHVSLWSITAILFSIDCVSFILRLRSKQNSLPYYSECCEPCSFCHVNIFIQNLIQAFCVFYLYTFWTIGLPWLWDTCTVNMNLCSLKIYCHILPLPPHNGHLSTTGTFFCSHCMVAPVERINCMQNVEVVIEAEGRGGWHPRASIFLFYHFIKIFLSS